MVDRGHAAKIPDALLLESHEALIQRWYLTTSYTT